jgi:hypothetical protein
MKIVKIILAIIALTFLGATASQAAPKTSKTVNAVSQAPKIIDGRFYIQMNASDMMYGDATGLHFKRFQKDNDYLGNKVVYIELDGHTQYYRGFSWHIGYTVNGYVITKDSLPANAFILNQTPSVLTKAEAGRILYVPSYIPSEPV